VRGVGFYHAVSPESLQASNLLVHVNGVAPAAFASRLHDIAREVEPDLALVMVQSVDRAKDQDRREYAFWIRLIVAVCGLAILLSLAGIYAVMAFTVERRTREIGVRVALGAGPARVAGTIFRRPLLQVAGGLLMGFLISVWLTDAIDSVTAKPLLVLLGYAALMTMVCLLACVVPTRRALRVEPSEALSAEA
jgi:ABC-type antimicrobial peptide transport system permease subunit